MYPLLIQKLINELTKLPSVGPKQAERFVFHLIKNKSELKDIINALNRLSYIKICSLCGNITFEKDLLCSICKDPQRNKVIICLVKDIPSLFCIEKTNQYNGLYHVLNGLISPSKNIGPENLRIKELEQRIKSDPKIKEVILALDFSLEGETTAMYLANLLKSYKIKITRLSRGLPTGAQLEYADEISLSESLKSRKEIS